ncbi:MAG: deoxyribodipyrimidine photo-lyase [Parvicella sp.]
MNKEKINIVWLKRDLRTNDHRSFYEAENSELPYIALYIYEPEVIAYSDTSLRHLQFIYHSIADMNKRLNPFEIKVEICYGSSVEIFKSLLEQFSVQNVFSYQESGIELTWKTDKQLNLLFANGNVNWNEFQRDAIVRGIKNRKGWDYNWAKYITSNSITNTYTTHKSRSWSHSFAVPIELMSEWSEYSVSFQPAGESNGWKYLSSFAKDRGKNYAHHISKPELSRTSCGRISPYLAWGNMSIRQAYQFVRLHNNYNAFKFSFDGFLMRLKWHCHFIQKFEVECAYETHCLNIGYEYLEHTNDDNLLKAWKEGKTGLPLVDACMRCVIATGWINFRMRAMLVSILTLHFDQDWRRGVYHLAQQFLDYEPGIHYPQFQMQAGTTGINTVRMYNPIKQSQDNDPEGVFIKKWVPELREVPVEFIHEPWRMELMDQQFCGVEIGVDYPNPVIDLKEVSKIARDKIWGHKKHPAVVKEKRRIIELHTRNEFSPAKRKVVKQK